MPYQKMFYEGCAISMCAPILAFWVFPPHFRIYYSIKAWCKKRDKNRVVSLQDEDEEEIEN
jgi:hypothetical protein